MSNYIEYNDKIAFHPGYYINELVETSGLTQKDFALRLDTTPKNLSVLINGNQSLSIDIAMKLSRLMGTSIEFWLNLQQAYDSLIAEFESDKELERERVVFKKLDYNYFKDHYGLPDLPRQVKRQIVELRGLLKVSTLCVLSKPDLAVNFRGNIDRKSDDGIIRANTLVQIAINKALEIEAPKFDRKKFDLVTAKALSLTDKHSEFYEILYELLLEAGVIFIILPNLPGSNINGATKKIGDSIMLMVNDRRCNSDTFWFTLFHEFGHIKNGDYGVSFVEQSGEEEVLANKYAEDMLIPHNQYECFVERGSFLAEDIKGFANEINRDPGIVLGRLQSDEYVGYKDPKLMPLRKKYVVKVSEN